ncbi:MAG TPA: carbonic anhydrase [Bdellovibrionota bacterium]|jgi:carbonic anhydrase
MRNLFVCASLFLSLSAFAADHTPAAAAPKTPTGWEALSLLQTGNMRFYEGRALHPNQEPSRRELLAGGQHPHTIIVSCSDSRTAPETVFDQGLGELFVVRLAGNVATTEGIASIEYAVEHLGPKLLLVMGHESCGAVGAAIASTPGKSNGSESLDVLVRQIRAGLSSESVAAGAADKTYRWSVKENVTENLKALLQRSEIIRNAVATKGLVLGQAIYNLKSGRVEFWDVGRAMEVGALEKTVVKEQKVVEEVIPSDPLVKPKAPSKPKPKAVAPAHH